MFKTKRLIAYCLLFLFVFGNVPSLSADIQEVTIGNENGTVTDEIVRQALNGISGSYKATIEEGATSIGGHAFEERSNTPKLSELTLPESLRTIETGAFSYCTNLSTVSLPKAVETLQPEPFQKCESLTRIEVDSENRWHQSVDANLK